jgi:undecaprenyl-diphosphatase
VADPITDGSIIAISAGFAGLLELVAGTGEVRPQQISQSFDRNSLLGIDRGALSQRLDSNASTFSNIGLFAAVGFAVVDPLLTGVREKSVQSALVDAIIYAESIAITWGVTNLAKIAVRRPRPNAYLAAEANKNDPNFSNADTDSALSFFSGHASMTAAVAATATYLAFARSPRSVRPWVTLIAGSALAAFVSYERVRAGKHFPTDVIAGTMAGAAIGVLVPHFHRSETDKQRPLWMGFVPEQRGTGGILSLSGLF